LPHICLTFSHISLFSHIKWQNLSIYSTYSMYRQMNKTKRKSENEFTTVRLERDLVEEMQSEMSYGDSYNSYLKNKLEI